MQGVQPKPKARPIRYEPSGPTWWFLYLDPRLAVQEVDLEDAEEVQPHDDDDHAADHRQDVHVAPDELADGARPGAERHEHGREAEHEGHRRQEHRPPLDLGRRVAGELVEADAGEVAEIGRDQRQDAGREEREQPGEERSAKGDVDRHDARGTSLNRTAGDGRRRYRPSGRCRHSHFFLRRVRPLRAVQRRMDGKG